jgi:hypothetical protein
MRVWISVGIFISDLLLKIVSFLILLVQIFDADNHLISWDLNGLVFQMFKGPTCAHYSNKNGLSFWKKKSFFVSQTVFFETQLNSEGSRWCDKNYDKSGFLKINYIFMVLSSVTWLLLYYSSCFKDDTPIGLLWTSLRIPPPYEQSMRYCCENPILQS